jgi:hypothetical protein
LIYALINGSYDIRKISAEVLGKINHIHAFPALLSSINDPVKIVSITAIEAIKKFDDSINYQETINSRIEYWQKEEIKPATNTTPPCFPKTSKFKKKVKMERLEQVRQMLRKPMRR